MQRSNYATSTEIKTTNKEKAIKKLRRKRFSRYKKFQANYSKIIKSDT